MTPEAAPVTGPARPGLTQLICDILPTTRTQELYAGLREFGVPVEFVSYPREGHPAREPAHVADQRERVLRWFASHLEAS